MYAAGAKGYYDVMAVHPYMGNADLGPEAPTTRGRARMTHTARAASSLMAAKGDGAKPIWFTEFGWSTHANTATTPVWFLGVSEADAGRLPPRTLAMVQAQVPAGHERVLVHQPRPVVDGAYHQNNRGPDPPRLHRASRR